MRRTMGTTAARACTVRCVMRAFASAPKRVARLLRAHSLRGKVADLYRSRAGAKAFFTSIPNRQLGVLADAPTGSGSATLTYLRSGGRVAISP